MENNIKTDSKVKKCTFLSILSWTHVYQEIRSLCYISSNDCSIYKLKVPSCLVHSSVPHKISLRHKINPSLIMIQDFHVVGKWGKARTNISAKKFKWNSKTKPNISWKWCSQKSTERLDPPCPVAWSSKKRHFLWFFRNFFPGDQLH